VERLGDPSIGFVTVTGVRATTDFSQAIVYVSVLGSEKRRQRSLRALERAHGVLQQRVAQELRLRRTPQLIFQYDETVDRALRMSELIDQVVPASLPEPHGDETPDDR
jgi:ribosome-binding factor A